MKRPDGTDDPCLHQHIDCGGERCVIGWDGLARASPMDEAELAQREADEAEHGRQTAHQPTVEERLQKLLDACGLTLEELRAVLKP